MIDMIRSSDDGRSWQEYCAPITGLPAQVDGAAKLYFWGKCVEPSPGHLVQGFYYCIQAGQGDRYANGVCISGDCGQSWRFAAHLCADASLGTEGPNETDLEQFANGELLAVCRTGGNAPIYQFRSQDGGRTWSRPVETGARGVSPQLLLLENGVLVMPMDGAAAMDIVCGSAFPRGLSVLLGDCMPVARCGASRRYSIEARERVTPISRSSTLVAFALSTTSHPL